MSGNVEQKSYDLLRALGSLNREMLNKASAARRKGGSDIDGPIASTTASCRR